MFAYCGNNPVNRTDYTGKFWSELLSFVKEAVNQIGQGFKSVAPAYVGMGAGACADGPLPFADIAMAVGAAALTVGVIGYGVYEATQEKEEDVAIELSESKDSNDTIIYRWYATKTENLAPRPDKDYDGLSFSTNPPRPGVGAVVTTINTVNATGILHAKMDKPGHVAITPVGVSVKTWMAQGQKSIWSKTLSEIVVEWDSGD